MSESSGPVARGPAYTGIPTFLRRPLVDDVDALRAIAPTVAIMGAPWDDSVVYRPGARFGPRSIRQASHLTTSFHVAEQIDPFAYVSAVDFGDAACVPGLVDVSHRAIGERVAEIASVGALPFVVGGDHSITFPSASAVAEALSPRTLGVLHFDTHTDTGTAAWGNPASHGTPMRRLIDSGFVSGSNFVQVGLRGYWPLAEDFEWMRAQGLRWHTMDEIDERGFDVVLAEAIEQLSSGVDCIYLSIDIDVVEPGMAPGTGTPEPGGLTPRELLRGVRRVCRSLDVAALDITEVSPPYDHADVTAALAVRLMLEAITGLALRTVDGDGDGAA